MHVRWEKQIVEVGKNGRSLLFLLKIIKKRKKAKSALPSSLAALKSGF
jgi:hypothetical protein